MARTHPDITPELKKWIEQQPMFFIASAPLQADGHINLSPRVLDSLRVTAPDEVVILDLTGSGNETAAHLAQNGRLTIMFCAFDAEPRILRLYGRASVIGTTHKKWHRCRSLFPDDIPGVRQIFQLSVQRVQTSCGFGVPLMNFVSQRDTLLEWAMRKGPEGIKKYQQEKNHESIDALPAP